jgi:dihydrofolate reductase
LNIPNKIQKIVFSTTLNSANWLNSRMIKDKISSEISQIKKMPGKNLAIVGGAKIAQTFTKLDLIDDYQLYVHPMIL